jgi:hypothetical protein
MASGGVEDWLRTELHDVVGYSDKTLSQFILSLANKATSATALHGQLLASGIDEGPRVRPFAEALFQRIMQSQKKGGTVRPGGGAGGIGGAAASSVRGRQPTNAELIRQSQQYTLVESDDEDYARALGGGKDGKSGSGSSKAHKKDKKDKKDKKERHSRKSRATLAATRKRTFPQYGSACGM